MDDVGKGVHKFLAESGFLRHERSKQLYHFYQHPVIGGVGQHLEQDRRQGDVILGDWNLGLRSRDVNKYVDVSIPFYVKLNHHFCNSWVLFWVYRYRYTLDIPYGLTLGFFRASSQITLTAAHCTPGSGSSSFSFMRGNAGRSASGNFNSTCKGRGL